MFRRSGHYSRSLSNAETKQQAAGELGPLAGILRVGGTMEKNSGGCMLKPMVWYCVLCVSGLVLLPILLGAQSTPYVFVGTNTTFLRNEGSETRPGVNIGGGYSLDLIPHFNEVVNLQGGYTLRQLTVPQKTWPSGELPEFSSEVVIGDVPLGRSYVEFGAQLGYHVLTFHKRGHLQLWAGPTLSIPLRYATDFLADSTQSLAPEDQGTYPFDYVRCEESRYEFLFQWSVGMSVYYRQVGVGLRYDRAASQDECMRGLSIHDAVDSLNLLLYYTF